jgi:hypothetical protein
VLALPTNILASGAGLSPAVWSGGIKPTEFYKWWVTDPETGARIRTTYRMDRKTALERFPGAQPDPLTREVRNLPESPDEWNVARRG